MDYNKAALELHSKFPGKIAVQSLCECKDRDALSTAPFLPFTDFATLFGSMQKFCYPPVSLSDRNACVDNVLAGIDRCFCLLICLITDTAKWFFFDHLCRKPFRHMIVHVIAV